MSFPSPLFIQNRNHYTAAQEIGRGVPLILTPDGKQVTPASAATDNPIGISTNNYHAGEVVEVVWIGFTDIAVTGCVPGDQIRLNASGAASKDGEGTFLGVAAGKSVGAFTVVRIGLLGYKPPEGGGGSPLVPMNLQVVEVTDPSGVITLPASSLSESQFIMATGDYQVTGIKFTGTMDMAAPVGTQIITNLLVFNEDLAPEIELSVSHQYMNLFGNRYATNREGIAAWTLTATRVNLDMGGDIMDGWMVVSDPIRQAVPADGVTYDADSRWPDPRPASVQEALDTLAAAPTVSVYTVSDDLNNVYPGQAIFKRIDTNYGHNIMFFQDTTDPAYFNKMVTVPFTLLSVGSGEVVVPQAQNSTGGDFAHIVATIPPGPFRYMTGYVNVIYDSVGSPQIGEGTLAITGFTSF